MTARHVVCLTTLANGQVGGGWGRADNVALVTVENGVVVSREDIVVGWNALHDTETDGGHHARIVRFLREHEVTDVATGHMGDGMQNTLTKLGTRLHLGVEGDAEAIALATLA